MRHEPPPDGRSASPTAESQGEQCFLFVGEAGSPLGGMQDYYGAYGSSLAARRAVPEGVHWAEIAAVRGGTLEVVATGERTGGGWHWQNLDAPHATPPAATPPAADSAPGIRAA